MTTPLTAPTPLPPKDNKCESSSGCGVAPVANSASSASSAGGKATTYTTSDRPTSASAVDDRCEGPKWCRRCGKVKGDCECKPNRPNPSEPVASGERQIQRYSINRDGEDERDNLGAWVTFGDHLEHTASLQHEAEKAKGEIETLTNVSNDQVNEIARLQSELAGVRGSEQKMLAAVIASEEAHKSLFHQCFSNGMKNAWGKDVDCTKLNEAGRLASLALSSRPLAPAEAKK